MEVEKAFIFTDSSVISFPYLASGTLLVSIAVVLQRSGLTFAPYKDLSNACRSQTIEECVATFYTLEMLHIVHALHSIGIIHADVKPDNFMLRDIQLVVPSRLSYQYSLSIPACIGSSQTLMQLWVVVCVSLTLAEPLIPRLSLPTPCSLVRVILKISNVFR